MSGRLVVTVAQETHKWIFVYMPLPDIILAAVFGYYLRDLNRKKKLPIEERLSAQDRRDACASSALSCCAQAPCALALVVGKRFVVGEPSLPILDRTIEGIAIDIAANAGNMALSGMLPEMPAAIAIFERRMAFHAADPDRVIGKFALITSRWKSIDV